MTRSNLDIRTVNMTPEMAQRHIDITNAAGGQRPVSAGHVRKIAAEMEAGNFNGLNGETIKVNCDGRVIDGQHRLHAIVATGKPVDVTVVYGLDFDEVFGTLAVSKPRSASDELSAMGHSNTRILSTAAGIWRRLSGGDWPGSTPSHGCSVREVVDTVNKYPMLEMCATYGKSDYDRQVVRVFSAACLAALHAVPVYMDADEREMCSYIAAAAGGTERYAGDPARVAWAQSAKAKELMKGGALPIRFQMAVLISGWNNCVIGKTYEASGSKFVWRTSHRFPRIAA